MRNHKRRRSEIRGGVCMKTRAYEIIIKPIVSEKSMNLSQDKKYLFRVDRRANKIEIRDAIEEIFKVDVESVHTMNMLGKNKRVGAHTGKRADWKKAIIKLKSGSREIPVFEN